MENTCKEQESESSSTGVYELPGDPAIVINGVPDVSPRDGTLVLCDISDAESCRKTGFGEWLEGREVRKLFGEQLYSGTVTKFDKETGWYRVVYEDGDFEDLEWHELEELLLPLDITVPLKALALKIIRKSQKPMHRSGKYVARSKNRRAKNVEGNGKITESLEEASSTKFDNAEKIKCQYVAPHEYNLEGPGTAEHKRKATDHKIDGEI